MYLYSDIIFLWLDFLWTNLSKKTLVEYEIYILLNKNARLHKVVRIDLLEDKKFLQRTS